MKMYIGGKAVEASDGKTIPVINPATGEQFDTIPSATPEDIEQAVRNAQEGAKEWEAVPLYERCNIIRRYAELLEAEKETFVRMIVRDNGKSLVDARAEMERMPALTRGYAERANHLYTNVLPDTQAGMEHDFIFSVREPLGVVACVISYNYPMSAFSQKVPSALVMGNAVIVKPATDAATANIHAVELLLKAGVPGNAIQILTGRGSVIGDRLLDNPGVHRPGRVSGKYRERTHDGSCGRL